MAILYPRRSFVITLHHNYPTCNKNKTLIHMYPTRLTNYVCRDCYVTEAGTNFSNSHSKLQCVRLTEVSDSHELNFNAALVLSTPTENGSMLVRFVICGSN